VHTPKIQSFKRFMVASALLCRVQCTEEVERLWSSIHCCCSCQMARIWPVVQLIINLHVEDAMLCEIEQNMMCGLLQFGNPGQRVWETYEGARCRQLFLS
jgi:hypothetical protein